MKSNIVQIKELRVFEERPIMLSKMSQKRQSQNMGPQGLADEGERIHSIVDEMEAEDQTAMEMEEYEGSSDNEQYSLPKEWKEHGFDRHVAEDVRNQEWEYRGNEVVQGATYLNIEAVKDLVSTIYSTYSLHI